MWIRSGDALADRKACRLAIKEMSCGAAMLPYGRPGQAGRDLLQTALQALYPDDLTVVDELRWSWFKSYPWPYYAPWHRDTADDACMTLVLNLNTAPGAELIIRYLDEHGAEREERFACVRGRAVAFPSHYMHCATEGAERPRGRHILMARF